MLRARPLPRAARERLKTRPGGEYAVTFVPQPGRTIVPRICSRALPCAPAAGRSRGPDHRPGSRPDVAADPAILVCRFARPQPGRDRRRRCGSPHRTTISASPCRSPTRPATTRSAPTSARWTADAGRSMRCTCPPHPASPCKCRSPADRPATKVPTDFALNIGTQASHAVLDPAFASPVAPRHRPRQSRPGDRQPQAAPGAADRSVCDAGHAGAA